MGDFVVGRSEGVAYSNNNLTYKQFNKNDFRPILKKKEDTEKAFIDKIINKIKQANNDKEIKEALCEVYFSTQYDSSIRAEFDQCFNNL